MVWDRLRLRHRCLNVNQMHQYQMETLLYLEVFRNQFLFQNIYFLLKTMSSPFPILDAFKINWNRWIIFMWKVYFCKRRKLGVVYPSGLHTGFTGLPLKRSAVQYSTIYILLLTSQQRLNFVPITELLGGQNTLVDIWDVMAQMAERLLCNSEVPEFKSRLVPFFEINFSKHNPYWWFCHIQ